MRANGDSDEPAQRRSWARTTLGLAWWLPWSVLLGVIASWPMGAYPGAIPTSPNFPLHALFARHLSRLGSPMSWQVIPFPDGQPIAMMGGASTAIAAVLNAALPAWVAMNLGVMLSVALGACCVMALCRSWGWRPSAQAASAAAIALAPFTLRELSEARYENVAFGAFAVVLLALGQRGWRAALLGGAGLIWAAFSSPYQALAAGLVMCLGIVTVPRGDRRWLVLALIAALATTLPYYLYEALPGSEAASLYTPSAVSPGPVSLAELVTPPAGADVGSRLAWLGTRTPYLPPASVPFSPRPPLQFLVFSGYLGVVLAIAGALGLLLGLRERRLWPVVLTALFCLLLSLGDELRLTADTGTGVPLPLAWLPAVPLLGRMVMLHRLAGFVSFVLALGIGRLVTAAGPTWQRALAPILVAALLLDGTALSDTHWPVPMAHNEVPPSLTQLPPGPIATWPGEPCWSRVQLEHVALVLDRPVAMHGGLRQVLAGEGERVITTEQTSETPEAWLARVQAAGAHGWLRAQDLPCGDAWPEPPMSPERERCDDGWCTAVLGDDPGTTQP